MTCACNPGPGQVETGKLRQHNEQSVQHNEGAADQ